MSVTFTSNLGVVLNASEKVIMRAADVIGGMAESYAKEYCPVDTGRLRNSIAHAVVDGGHVVVIGSNVVYAPYQELGTSKMAEHPFLRPAIENHKDEYKNILQNLLKG